jgi:quercetin dioxygenase-like cupin family protein
MTFDRPAAADPTRGAAHASRVVAHLASTGGGYRLTEATSAPGSCVPSHVHDDAVECFYVIEGRYRLTVHDTVHHLCPGDVLLIPRGAPHRFEVLGREQGRALEVFAPAGFEPAPGLFGGPGAPWRRPGPPLPGPSAVVLAGDTRSTLVVSLRSDLASGAYWRIDPTTTAVWVLAGRYRLDTDAGPVALGEGEVLSAEHVGGALAVATAPSSRALILRL